MSIKKVTNITNKHIPNAYGYTSQPGPKQGSESASFAGCRRWINAVATMTPEPKYFAKKNANAGIRTREDLDDTMGNNAPKHPPAMITNMDEIRAASISGELIPVKQASVDDMVS